MIRDEASLRVATRICKVIRQPYTDLMVRLVASMIQAAVVDDEQKQRLESRPRVVVDNTGGGT